MLPVMLIENSSSPDVVIVVFAARFSLLIDSIKFVKSAVAEAPQVLA